MDSFTAPCLRAKEGKKEGDWERQTKKERKKAEAEVEVEAKGKANARENGNEKGMLKETYVQFELRRQVTFSTFHFRSNSGDPRRLWLPLLQPLFGSVFHSLT